MLEVDVPTTAAGENLNRLGQRAVLRDERVERVVAASARVDVEDHDAADGAGAHADVGVRPLASTMRRSPWRRCSMRGVRC
jgi:hypothetical protein